MKQFAVVVLATVGMMLTACGSNSHVMGNINGNWQATLNSSGAEMFTFTTLLTVNADGSLGTSNFVLSVNNSACGFTPSTETGSFTLSGNFNGMVTGTFQYTITSTGVEKDTLMLNGTANNGQITGTWSLSGQTQSCSGNGTFTMTPAAMPLM